MYDDELTDLQSILFTPLSSAPFIGTAETMERRVEHEQLAGHAWRLAYERERKEAMQQHERDQLAIADLDVEMKELRADIFLNKLELQRAQDRIASLKYVSGVMILIVNNGNKVDIKSLWW